MTAPRLYHGRVLARSGGSMIAAALAIAFALTLGVFLACAWPYVANLQR